MKRIIFVLLFAAALPAMAVTVANITTATQVFFDNFENGLAANSPSAGTWSTIGPDVGLDNSVSPGPAEGSFYASLFRNSDTNKQGNLQAALSAVQSNPGDLIELTFMLYIPSASDGNARAQLLLDNGNFNSARAWVIPCGPVTVGSCQAGHVGAVGPGFADTDTGLLYATDTWQEWNLFYVIGASTFDVQVNGVKATGFPSFTTGAVGFADLFNGIADPSGTFFLDAVPAAHTSTPEPGSMLLLGAGLGTTAAIRWNKR
jgi:hypothetical protein